MELKPNVCKSVAKTLAVAACSLLAHEAKGASGAPADDWDIDISLFHYSEVGRIKVVEPALLAKTSLGEEEFVTVRGVYDSMTGATPNGATVSSGDRYQTITSCSSGTSKTIRAGELPTADFRDTRISLGLDWERRTSRLINRTWSLNYSREHDYASLGGSATYTFDSEDRLTTYTLGAGVSLDSPCGTRHGVAWISPILAAQSSGRQQKTVVDLLAGVTRVIDRKTLAQFNYAHGQSSGFLNDPYKMLAMVDPVTGDVSITGMGIDGKYFYEERPSSRSTNSLFAKVVHQFDEDVLHLSYRYYWDDWGIRSHTTDAKYRLELGNDLYLQPHARYYTQTAADFFRSSLVSGESLPTYASADLRLGAMQSVTAGLRVGYSMGNDSEVALRVEQMKQTGKPSRLVGNQKEKDIYPDLDASMVELSYSFLF